jgi:hypothetical protein
LGPIGKTHAALVRRVPDQGGFVSAPGTSKVEENAPLQISKIGKSSLPFNQVFLIIN